MMYNSCNLPSEPEVLKSWSSTSSLSPSSSSASLSSSSSDIATDDDYMDSNFVDHNSFGRDSDGDADCADKYQVADEDPSISMNHSMASGNMASGNMASGEIEESADPGEIEESGRYEPDPQRHRLLAKPKYNYIPPKNFRVPIATAPMAPIIEGESDEEDSSHSDSSEATHSTHSTQSTQSTPRPPPQKEDLDMCRSDIDSLRRELEFTAYNYSSSPVRSSSSSESASDCTNSVSADNGRKPIQRGEFLSKMAHLEDKIEAAIDVLFDEKFNHQCPTCDQLETNLVSLQSKQDSALSTIRKLTKNLNSAEKAIQRLNDTGGKHTTKIVWLESEIEQLQSQTNQQAQQRNKLESKVQQLDENLKRSETKFEQKFQDLGNNTKNANLHIDTKDSRKLALCEKILKLESTVEVLVDEFNSATERLADAQADVLVAALNGDDVAAQRVYELEDENYLLQNKNAKLNKELSQTKESLQYLTRQKQTMLDKLNGDLNTSNDQIDILQKKLGLSEESNAERIKDLEHKMNSLSDEKDDTVFTLTELATRCGKLSLEKEGAMAKASDSERERDSAKASILKLSMELKKVGFERNQLEKNLAALHKAKAESEKDLMRKHKDSEDQLRRLSNEVIFAHEEISRLSSEKKQLQEESEMQLSSLQSQIKSLQEEQDHHSTQYQELWSKSNHTFLEKESALATIQQLKDDIEQSEQFAREREKLLSRIQLLARENKQHFMEIDRLSEVESNLLARNAQLVQEKEDAVSQITTTLQLEIESLQQQNLNLQSQMENLQSVSRIQKSQLLNDLAESASDEDDLTYKVNALSESMELRLQEKEVQLTQLETKYRYQSQQNELLETRLDEMENTNSSLRTSLQSSHQRQMQSLREDMEQMKLEMQGKDETISKLHGGEKYYKNEIERLQNKVGLMERWLQDSLNVDGNFNRTSW